MDYEIELVKNSIVVIYLLIILGMLVIVLGMNNGILLIVDDHEAIRAGLKLVFEAKTKDAFSEVVEARDGNEALLKSNGKKVSAAVVDLMMPGMDGVTLCRKLRERDGDVKLVILTAKSDAETKEEVIKSGAADKLLIKPIDNNVLVDEVMSLLIT